MNIRPVINHVFGYSTTFYVYSSTRSLYIYHIFVQWSFWQVSQLIALYWAPDADVRFLIAKEQDER